jgi:quinohemoprotein ethanol dehydrogenase
MQPEKRGPGLALLLGLAIAAVPVAIVATAFIVQSTAPPSHSASTTTVTETVTSTTPSTTTTAPTTTTGATTITPAPSFTAADLTPAPTDGWLTNGGDLTNDRYSPLTAIGTSNVSKLKGVWIRHLRGSGVAAKFSSGETQPIIYKGVIYTTTGNDDVFALSVLNGSILWEHKSDLDQTISTVCCGWLNRGVALGDGRLYLGRLDGKVMALDQKTGKTLWTRQVVQWQKGQTVTGAPLYMDGKIYIGVVGADYGTRGFLEAFDAKTGKSLWRFYTIPGPHDPGGDTWPAGTAAYLRGGASIWSTPAYDPKLGLLYFATGNTGSDWYGGERKGTNLYANSIIALDATTGKLKWYYQEVHHDIWDYDAPSPVVLFDTKSSSGADVKGIAQPGKTGWLYMLDRATGKPLFPSPEKAVPQNAAQKTWPTQPIPSVGAFIPHGMPPAAQIARVDKERTGASKKLTLDIAKTMYTPPSTTKMTIYSPGPQGGDNWEPSSYNPKTNMFYVCSAYQTVGVQAASNPFKVGQSFSGIGALSGLAWTESTGTFTAISATTGKVVWQKQWPESCYSGTATTAGNLVFVGRNAGQLQAYNATNGKMLWSFQTGAGANGSPTFFQQDGKEYVAFYAAGNSLQASPHGDNFWLFSLDGTVGPLPAPGKGTGTEHAGEGGGGTTTTAGDAAAGKAIFGDNCATCHGSLGTGGNGGPDLTSIPSAKQVLVVTNQVTNGGGGMPPFKGTLTKQQIANVAAYVTKNITNKNK